MIWNTRFIARVIILSLLGVSIASSALAQHGPGMHRSDSDQQHGVPYDTKTEVTLKGTVADVKTRRSALYWLFRIHTLGQRQMERQKQLLLNTDIGKVEIHLGPTAFLTKKRVQISEGDSVEVTGSRFPVGDSQVVLAREVRKGGNTWTLRDATGQPLWNNAQTESRGFWTKKKVLITVVAVKVALLATVLRH